MKNVMNKFNIFSEWVMNLFILQLLWIGGTLIGGVIFGLFPATIALYASLRKLKHQVPDFKLFRYFVQEYKNNFKTSFIIGLFYIAAGLLGVVYYHFLNATTNSWLAYTHPFMYIILILILFVLLYLIPVFVHYEVRLRSLVQTTFLIMMSHMKWNLPLLLTLVAVSILFIRFSVVFLFFGISLPAFIILYYCMRAFKDFDLEKEKIAD